MARSKKNNPGVTETPGLFLSPQPKRCLAISSAIWTAFVAAPLRRLSLTHQKASPFGWEMSLRMRPT